MEKIGENIQFSRISGGWASALGLSVTCLLTGSSDSTPPNMPERLRKSKDDAVSA